MALIEDFSVFFNPAEFADNATLGGVAVRGIFENAYELANVGLSGMAGSSPAFTLQTSAVPANPVGMVLVCSAIGYIVAEHQPNGTGVSVLILERSA